MKRYHVKFYYGADLRTDSTVDAHNEVAALVLALHEGGDTGWVDAPGFRVEITLA